eukprot:GILI01006537.1.p1 GENE.GILI01006537.1~~GILI01006537.1.p1  ORF type:complete len:557 (-),score=155.53 GILI01006537.1:91-1548(-)
MKEKSRQSEGSKIVIKRTSPDDSSSSETNKRKPNRGEAPAKKETVRPKEKEKGKEKEVVREKESKNQSLLSAHWGDDDDDADFEHRFLPTPDPVERKVKQAQKSPPAPAVPAKSGKVVSGSIINGGPSVKEALEKDRSSQRSNQKGKEKEKAKKEVFSWQDLHKLNLDDLIHSDDEDDTLSRMLPTDREKRPQEVPAPAASKKVQPAPVQAAPSRKPSNVAPPSTLKGSSPPVSAPPPAVAPYPPHAPYAPAPAPASGPAKRHPAPPAPAPAPYPYPDQHYPANPHPPQHPASKKRVGASNSAPPSSSGPTAYGHVTSSSPPSHPAVQVGKGQKGQSPPRNSYPQAPPPHGYPPTDYYDPRKPAPQPPAAVAPTGKKGSNSSSAPSSQAKYDRMPPAAPWGNGSVDDTALYSNYSKKGQQQVRQQQVRQEFGTSPAASFTSHSSNIAHRAEGIQLSMEREQQERGERLLSKLVARQEQQLSKHRR